MIELHELLTSIKKLFSPPLVGEIDDAYLMNLQSAATKAKELYSARERGLEARAAEIDNRILKLNRLSAAAGGIKPAQNCVLPRIMSPYSRPLQNKQN